MLQPHHLTLGERVFLQALEALVNEKAPIIKGAHVAMKRNANDDLVMAVIIPCAKLPPATREQKKASRESR